MKQAIAVFIVIMMQVTFSLAWIKFGEEPFIIWVVGCAIADFLTWVAYSIYNKDD